MFRTKATLVAGFKLEPEIVVLLKIMFGIWILGHLVNHVVGQVLIQVAQRVGILAECLVLAS